MKVSCEECGSNDNLAIYSDGHSHCFTPGCTNHAKPGTYDETGNIREERTTRVSKQIQQKDFEPKFPMLTNMAFRDINARGLIIDTCKSWNYALAKDERGDIVHVANFHDSTGAVVCQKTRSADKDFKVRGDGSKLSLWGMHKFRQGLCESLVITEGEIDAMTVDQVINGTSLNPSYAVVSLPNGSASAKKAIKQDFDYINSFKKIILCFDMDEPGRKAVQEALAVLPVGKVYIAVLQEKDANDMLLKGQAVELIKAIKQAGLHTPAGIVEGTKITLEDLKSQPIVGYDIPYPVLNGITRGIRKGELTLLAAGTGVGKSTLARELGYHLNMKKGLSIGNLYLEEKYTKTAQGYVAIHNNVPLGMLRQNPDILSDEQYSASISEVIANGRNFFFDHFGSLDGISLQSKLQFLASQGVDFIILDHISIVVSGMESSREGERKDIDILMTRLRSLIEETGIGVIAICHLSKNGGAKSHEEGGRVTLDDLRGSGTLKQIPDLIIALERNQQDPETSDEADVRVLKNREFGDLGLADRVKYTKTTGRLLPVDRIEAPEPVKETKLDKLAASKYALDRQQVPDLFERQTKILQQKQEFGDDDIPF